MPRVFKAVTAFGVTIELELIEKTRNMLVFRDRKTGRLYKLQVKKANDGKYVVDVNGVLYSVFSNEIQGVYVNSEPILVTSLSLIEIEEPKQVRMEKPTAVPAGEQGLIHSPITGKIVDVKVSPGSKVGKGDVLLLMESMKMIIEVKSEIDGIVEEVYVSPGKAVTKGEKLVKIKPL